MQSISFWVFDCMVSGTVARRTCGVVSEPSFQASVRRLIMQMAMTFMAVVAGMIFSLAVALLAEELIFGQVFRLFFASAKLAGQAAGKSEQKR
jgi:hypothetical protein